MSNYRNLSSRPPLPISAYFLYFKERSPRLRMDHPDFSPQEITRMIKNDWYNLQDDRKQAFRDLAAAEKEKWLQKSMAHNV